MISGSSVMRGSPCEAISLTIVGMACVSCVSGVEAALAAGVLYPSSGVVPSPVLAAGAMALCRDLSEWLAPARSPGAEPPECVVRLQAIVEERLEAARYLETARERPASRGHREAPAGRQSTGDRK